ncbi:MAG: primosomal protein N' [Candidatus Dependentiae bacterium]|nr:primosomal protein N' [Candidatus Dependentiae bacterium]
MFARIRLLNGCKKTFTYAVPERWEGARLCGSIVSVPFQRRVEKALVIDLTTERETSETFEMRELLRCEPFPEDAAYGPFIQALAAHCALDPFVLYQRLRACLRANSEKLEAVPPPPQTENCTTLTAEQEAAVAAILPDIDGGVFQATLLHGVTGSGKTEVYKRLFLHAHAQGKSALLLTPEVSLAIQFASLLRRTLGNGIPIFCFHSATPAPEKRALWQHLVNGKTVLIVGVHQPTLLPIPRLGIIIIDEEHEIGYQEKRHPKINTREAALIRAQLSKIPIVLGSATPSLHAWWCTEHRGWRRLSLTRRFKGNFPTVKLVNIRNDQRRRPSFWLSTELEKAIEKTLARHEQVIIYLNRRGYSFFVQCAGCGFIFSCKNCSVSLTLHEDQTLRCHYCGHQEAEPTSCPNRACAQGKLLKKGIGTQQVVSILQRRFPHARIARADLDTTVNKKKWHETVDRFTEHRLDILVGTQTITKGYHFPRVTLVGILWADVNLSIPFYNAAEATLQQLLQVAGRAGRQSAESLVIVQTLVDHQLFRFLDERIYPEFIAYELAYRQQLSYPPCSRFAEFELRHEDERMVDVDARTCAEAIRAYDASFTVLGPSKPPVHRVKNVFMRKIYVKSPSYELVRGAYEKVKNMERNSSLFFTINPLQ